MTDTAIDQIPRRSRLDKLTPAEAAIRAAEEAVEAVPAADPLLTEAGQLLTFARARVADFVDKYYPTQAAFVGYPRLEPAPCARCENEAVAARLKAALRDADPEGYEPDGTVQGLLDVAVMLEKHMPDALPANEAGQVHFARGLGESAAATIRAYLASLSPPDSDDDDPLAALAAEVLEEARTVRVDVVRGLATSAREAGQTADWIIRRSAMDLGIAAVLRRVEERAS